jgi:uncharacterized membrane protein (Fun14 family)
MTPFRRILQLLKFERKEIGAIYFYAILSGLIQLSLPVGVQAIVGFVLGASMSTSLIILIALVVLGVMVAGLMQINQMKIIEKIQQQVFVRYAFEFADRIPKLDLKKADSFYITKEPLQITIGYPYCHHSNIIWPHLAFILSSCFYSLQFVVGVCIMAYPLLYRKQGFTNQH